MDESPALGRIEQLVEEEERLWQAAGHGEISAEDHRRLEGIESPAPDRRKQRRALDQLISRRRVQDPARNTVTLMVRAADALKRPGRRQLERPSR